MVIKNINIKEKFKNLKVQTKVIIGFSVLIIFFLILSSSFLISIYKISDTQKLIKYSLICINTIKQIRMFEKDFFITKDLEKIKNIEEEIKILKSYMAKILEKESNKTITSKVKILSIMIDDYRESLYKVVNLYIKKGVNFSSGLNLSLINYMKNIENLIEKQKNKDVMVNFKNIQLIVNKYNEINEKKLVNIFGQEIQKLRDIVKDKEIKKEIDNLAEIFYLIVSLNNEIYYQQIEFNEYISKIEPFMNNYNNEIDKYIENIKLKTLIFSFIIFILLLLSGIISGIITTRGVVRPIKAINRSTNSIKDITKDLSKVIEINANSTLSISNTITKINSLIEEQSFALIESMNANQDLINNIIEIAEISHSKKESLEKLLKDAIINNEIIAQINNLILRVYDNSKLMLNTSKIIEKIADKTKVLAVNSGIEASNAGDFGKVLKIVAKEIKDLSYMTANNAVEISNIIDKNLNLIKNVANISQDVFNNSNKFLAEIKNNVDAIIKIINQLDNISQYSLSVIKNIQSLSLLNENVKNLSNKLSFMTINIDKNIEKLINVKSFTYNTIYNIIDNINQL